MKKLLFVLFIVWTPLSFSITVLRPGREARTREVCFLCPDLRKAISEIQDKVENLRKISNNFFLVDGTLKLYAYKIEELNKKLNECDTCNKRKLLL